MRILVTRVWFALAAAALFTAWTGVASAHVSLKKVDWDMLSHDLVRFHLQFQNPEMSPSGTVDGEVYSQPFGAFVPRESLIHTFHLDPIPAESFFDIFFDVSVMDLSPNAERLRDYGLSLSGIISCPPDTFWAGNVDIIWGGLGGNGQANAHFGTVYVCPGGNPSYIHVLVGCGVFPGAFWNIVNTCPAGWTASLVSSKVDGKPNGPAPNPLPLAPPIWAGWLCIQASGNVAVGDTCCVDLNVSCGGLAAKVHVCAEACECPGVPVLPTTWGRIKAFYN